MVSGLGIRPGRHLQMGFPSLLGVQCTLGHSLLWCLAWGLDQGGICRWGSRLCWGCSWFLVHRDLGYKDPSQSIGALGLGQVQGLPDTCRKVSLLVEYT